MNPSLATATSFVPSADDATDVQFSGGAALDRVHATTGGFPASGLSPDASFPPGPQPKRTIANANVMPGVDRMFLISILLNDEGQRKVTCQ
jgi:hypothetical protein